jgi:ankyrin repeat protein
MNEKEYYSNPTLALSYVAESKIRFEYFPEDPAECVRYVMAKISRCIFLTRKSHDSDYTFESIIELDAKNKELRYIWTAVMVFAKRYPDLKINFKEIKIKGIDIEKLSTSGFDPEKEWGGFFLEGFTKGSFYEEVFKHYLTEEMYEIKEFPIAFTDIPVDQKYRTVEAQEEFKLQQMKEQIERRRAEIRKLRQLAPNMTFEQFPEEPAETVRYVMAYISRYIFLNQKLANLEKGIKYIPEKIILHNGSTNVRYVWTALMLFGKRYPDLNLGYETIIVDDPTIFFPEKEWGGFFQKTFTKDSFYEKVFKHHLTEEMFVIQEFPRAFKDVPIEYRTIEEQERFIRQTEREKEEVKKQEEPQREEKKQEERYWGQSPSVPETYDRTLQPTRTDTHYSEQALREKESRKTISRSNPKKHKLPSTKKQEDLVPAAPSRDRLANRRLHKEKGASINSHPLYPAARDEQPKTASYLIESTSEEVTQKALYAAAVKGDLMTMKHLVANKVSIHEKFEGKPLLFCAAYCGHFEMVKWLVETGVFLHEKDDNGFTPLHAAAINAARLDAIAYENHLKIMEYLVLKGVSVNEKSIKNGFTVLDIAVTESSLEMVKCALRNGASTEGATLFRAVCAGDSHRHLEIAQSLVAYGASIHAQFEGETLLHCAARYGHLEMVKWLVERGLSPHEKDNKGSTALFRAFELNHLEVAEWLLVRIEGHQNDKENADQARKISEPSRNSRSTRSTSSNSALLKQHGAFAHSAPRSDTSSFDAMRALLEQKFKWASSITFIEENSETQITFNDNSYYRAVTEYLYSQFGEPAKSESYEEGIWRLLGKDNDSIALNYNCVQRIAESFSASSENKFV